MHRAQRRLAALVMTMAVATFLVLVERPVAKACQEECDADVAACHSACDNDANVADACASNEEACNNDCHYACAMEYNHCSVNRMYCGVPASGGCTVLHYRGWDYGDGWVAVNDQSPSWYPETGFGLRCYEW